MARTLTRLHIALNFTQLTDADRQSMLSGIEALAPTSSLLTNSPAIQASYASLSKRGALLAANVSAIASDRKKLEADIATATATRSAFDLELRSLATLTEAAAASPSDLHGMGFNERVSAAVPTVGPPPPNSITVKMPARRDGAVHVTAVYTGPGRPHFVAQQSPDPIGPGTWSPLVGASKTHALTGASGTHVWVRFATVRSKVQSDWCAAVMVVLP